MFTVTHSIQAVIPLSSYFTLSCNERTLNPHLYPMQHSTLVLSTISLTPAQISYRRNTQQALPITTHIAPFLATACLY
jgi:hypothetical protein